MKSLSIVLFTLNSYMYLQKCCFLIRGEINFENVPQPANHLMTVMIATIVLCMFSRKENDWETILNTNMPKWYTTLTVCNLLVI